MKAIDRYIDVVRKIQKRYKNADGSLTLTIHGKATRYSVLDNMAAIKYLGCDPEKMVSVERGLPVGFMASIHVRKVQP